MRINSRIFETAYGAIDRYAEQFINKGLSAHVEYTMQPDVEDDSIELDDGWSMQVGPYGLALNRWDELTETMRSWPLNSPDPVNEALAIMQVHSHQRTQH